MELTNTEKLKEMVSFGMIVEKISVKNKGIIFFAVFNIAIMLWNILK